MNNGHSVVLVSMFKDEAIYLDEWICHHLAIGVGQVVLYDNGSTDNSREVLRRYVNRGIVTLIDWPVRGGQIEAFNHATKFFGPSFDWIGFLDVDEMLILKENSSISEYLNRFGGNIEQVILPWRNFRFSGHRAATTGLTVENYLWAVKSELVQTKYFARTSSLVRAGVHSGTTKNRVAVDEKGELISPGITISNPIYELAQINHYQTRSLEEYSRRILKGEASGKTNRPPQDFPKGHPKDYSKWELDFSALPAARATREMMKKFQSLSESPHRFGFLEENKSLAYPEKGNSTLQYYLNKSFANNLLGLESSQTGTKFMFRHAADDSRNLTSQLSGWKANIFEYQAEDLVEAPPFLGSVHLADFLRRFSANILEWWAGTSRAGPLTTKLPRYHAVAVLVSAVARKDDFSVSFSINGQKYLRPFTANSGQVWSFYEYGFHSEEMDISIEFLGNFSTAEAIIVALP